MVIVAHLWRTTQCLVRPFLVVEFKILLQLLSGFIQILIGMQINLFLFHTAPESFDKHIIYPAAFSVHADLDVVVFQYPSDGFRGELTALIGIEDVRVFHND